MQLPARPHGVDGRMWITGIFVIRLPRILISLAVLLSTCHPQERDWAVAVRPEHRPEVAGGGRQPVAHRYSMRARRRRWLRP